MACLLLLQLTPLIWLAAAAASGDKSGCPQNCGDVSIPFPFGIGDGCHIGKPWFNLSCNGSSKPAKPYWGSLEVLNISLQGQLTFSSPVAEDCYNRSGRRESNDSVSILLYEDGPFTLSSTRTKFVAIGCDTDAYIYPFKGTNDNTGCTSVCQGKGMVVNNSCSGIGCCRASIPSGVKSLKMVVESFNNHSSVLDFNPCSYAFLIEIDQIDFSVEDLFVNNKYDRDQPVQAVLDWTIANQTCKIAIRDAKTFACESENSLCNDTDHGYRCDCEQGYRGNPYLTRGDGCVDIDECSENLHNCGEQKCKNTKGGYNCKRPFDKFVALMILLGIVISLFFILVIYWIYWGLERRKIIKLRDEFFRKNGGLLLQQQIASHGVTVATKIFSAEELERATNKYDKTQIIGRGGYGTVYKGILPNHGTVAIKKSKIVDESQIEQFINEVFILSQINHRNVVKLLGCCLETEVPLLVYEFISNGTLSNHIHDEAHPSTLSLEDRLRIASETAGALAYLHFAASIPIFHRDVKSTNILLDNELTAKVTDFGASRLIPRDQTQISTIVQGTLGYLDPEYLQTGQLTEKSDVYSFGVVLVELLTGEKPTSFTRSPEERNLSMYFLLSMKENSLFNVLDQRVVDEGGVEQLMSVSQLARRCLSLYGEERPTMKEVAIELEELKRSFAQPRAEDIDECNENLHNCGEQICKNTKGRYYCKRRFDKLVALMILLGIGISLLFILVISWIYWGLERRKIIKLRDEFFRKNGGLLLQQQIASHGVTVATKIFSAEELERATNKYDKTQIIGRGGYGTVYKGILPNHGTVAIKKSKIVDESQIEQFINEVFILSQINHRNVVKLLGCCLETEVPLLVYEFISNGTLSNHIHDEAHPSTLSLEDRLRIASETAEALAYLHFAASIPIFHRDVKSTNILLDNDLTAKVSDFGASRLIPQDQTQISTIVQGTLGYLDPEYLQTGQWTEKSDVYSFGVVLVELLTGEKPTSFTRGPEERNLSMYFLLSMKENSLFNVLDDRVVNEGGVEQLVAVSQLIKRCLSLNGDERPTMKEVAIELEELKRSFAQPRAEGKYEGTKVELCEPSEAYRGNDSVVGQDSLGNRSISLLEMGR